MDHDKPSDICEHCGGVKMGPIYWVDDAPKDVKICRKGRVAFSGEELDGEYQCDGSRVQTLSIMSAS